MSLNLDKIEKKLEKIEKYWLSLDFNNAQQMRGVVQQATEGRNKMAERLIKKLPEDDIVRESIQLFREGDEELQKQLDELENEVIDVINLGNKHKTLIKIFKRITGIKDIYSLVKNQIDPVSIMLHIQLYRPSLYTVLLEEAGGFEYIKILTLETFKRVEPKLKELCENV